MGLREFMLSNNRDWTGAQRSLHASITREGIAIVNDLADTLPTTRRGQHHGSEVAVFKGHLEHGGIGNLCEM